ncbi:MAG TPA: tripartite tricarboxylate transporter substrate binding protein [Paenirhodobacter sp.]
MSTISRRRLLQISGSIGAGLAMPAVLSRAAFAADAFASKPVTILCHTAPGSAADTYARQVAAALEPEIGQTVVVENRVGGNGMVQMAALKSAKPDGNTLGVNTISHLSILHGAGAGTFAESDFSWVVRVQTEGFFTVVRTDAPWQTLGDFVQAARTASPLLNIGGQGAPGSAHNIHINMLAQAGGFKFNWIPFPGGMEHLTALLGGSIEATSNNPQTVVQFNEAGRLRLLGFQGAERNPSFPDVPTYREAGFDVDPSWQQVRGLIGPAGIPEELQQRIAEALRNATEKSETWQKYMALSSLSPGYMGPAEYRDYITRQSQVTLDWMKKLGLA